jgi:hypothetical protein
VEYDVNALQRLLERVLNVLDGSSLSRNGIDLTVRIESLRSLAYLV